MAKVVKLGTTDRTVLVFIPDPASTDGSGKTGLAHTDMTVSGTRVETDNDVVITDYTASLNALTNLTDAHNDWGWKEVSSTLAPGLYRLDIADAIFASGAWYAVVYVQITTSAAAASPIEFELIAYDPLDTVRLGLTALPNAAADAAGGLIISDAGGLDADAQRADVAAILVDTGTTLDGKIDTMGTYIDTEVAAIKAKTDNLPSDPADASDIATATSAIAGYIDTEVAAILAAVDTEVAAIKTVTDAIGATGAGLTAVPWNAAWDAEVQSEVQDAIEANHLDHLLAADYNPASKPGVSTALLNELVESDAGVSRFTANALEQAPSGGGGGGGGTTAINVEYIG